MQLLNISLVAFWVVVAFNAARTYLSLKDTGLSRREITVITIVLLSLLNIVKGCLGIIVHETPSSTGQRLEEYLCVGSETFQILLSLFVLKYINKK